MYTTDDTSPLIIWNARQTDIESDCACAVSKPTVLISKNSELDDDCACPTPHYTNSHLQLNEGDIFITPADMIVQQLPGRHELLFNPSGIGKPVVVNESSKRIYDHFKTACTIEEAVQHFAQIPKDTLIDVIRKYIDLQFLQNTAFTAKYTWDQSELLTAWIHITNACNLACSYCYVNKSPQHMSLATGKRAIDAVFRSAKNHGYKRVKIKYAGGEPTLRFHTLITLHQYAQTLAERERLELDGVVLTNGCTLSEKMIASLQAHNLRLSISLDGIDQYHDRQRPYKNGKGSFKSIEHTLDLLKEAEVVPSITITITNQNVISLESTIAFLLSRGLLFSINFFRETNYTQSYSSSGLDHRITIENMKKAFKVIEEKLPAYPITGSLLDRVNLDTMHTKPCGVGESYMVIDHEGRIAKCHMVLEHPLTDIAELDPLKVIREDQSEIQNISVDEKLDCKDCTWRYWCAGGCPLTARTTDNEQVAKSSYCEIYRALIPEILRLEGLRLLKHANIETTD